MGTRAIIQVYDRFEDPIMTIYSQYDGYPNGIGADVARVLSEGVLSNGLSFSKGDISFNGMGDLAAHLIAQLKFDKTQIITVPGVDGGPATRKRAPKMKLGGIYVIADTIVGIPTTTTITDFVRYHSGEWYYCIKPRLINPKAAKKNVLNSKFDIHMSVYKSVDYTSDNPPLVRKKAGTPKAVLAWCEKQK